MYAEEVIIGLNPNGGWVLNFYLQVFQTVKN